MFDVGFSEMVVIMVVALFLFGPQKLPELGKALGGSIRAFKEGLRGVIEVNPKKEGA